VCAFIGMQAQVDPDKHGGRNPLVELAAAIDITGSRTEEERQLDALRGEQVAADWRDDPRLQQVAADPEQGVEAANAQGSYEAFMTMFGAPPPAAPNGHREGGEA
jgi:hypothetical protein